MQVQKTIGYFVYYRFFNPAIVSPDLYDITRLNLSPLHRKNLVQVAKILQSLFNFSEIVLPPHLSKINDFVKENLNPLSDYLSALVKVSDPADHLGVDEYIELTQGTKPVIIISYDEVFSTHELILNHLKTLAKEKKDPLKIIAGELGSLPEYDLSEEEMNREVRRISFMSHQRFN